MQSALYPAGGSICTVAHNTQFVFPGAVAHATPGVWTGGLHSIKHLAAHRKGTKTPNQQVLNKLALWKRTPKLHLVLSDLATA